MGHKITYTTNTKFKNAFRKSISENKDFLLRLENEEMAEMRWTQNMFNTGIQKGLEISVIQHGESLDNINTNSSDPFSIEILCASTDTLGNRNIKSVEV